MHRTKNRPVASGRMTVNYSIYHRNRVFTILGIVILYTALISKRQCLVLFQSFLYTSVYTPLKTKTPLSVFVGAIPGAIPFMLGWVAATRSFWR